MSSEEHINSIISLSKSEALQNGKFKDFLLELTPVVCRALSASKTSFYLYRSEKDEFESIQSFDVDDQAGEGGQWIQKNSNFSKKIASDLFVHVEASSEDKEHEEFAVDYLLKNKIRSWVSIQVWNENKLFGIITAEWRANKDFVEKDKLILLTAASMVSQCYDALLKLKEDFLHRNEITSLKLEEKEKEKLAKRLSDHAFYTSHTIRHPLATILALIDLIKLNWESRDAYEELLQQLKVETMNLDDAIRVMTAKIELD